MNSLKNLRSFVSSSGKQLFSRQGGSKFAKYGVPKHSIQVGQHGIHARTMASVTAVKMGGQLPASRKRATRGDFSQLGPEDISFFSNLLGKHRVLTNESDIEGYNIDWLKAIKGSSRLVLKPKSTNEISTIMKYCHEKNLAVCPQGGNTGIAGGGIAVHDEIVISTSLMNQVEHVDEWSGVLICQSGCVLDTLNEHMNEFDLMVPLDLGAKQSCQIGGNISTNAGGLRVLRYGSLHSSVIGCEVVLPDGTILNCMNTMKKDNTGYHLKHLFIGSEGTLGIVTKVALQCVPKPKAVSLAFLGLDSYQNVLKTFRLAKRNLGEILSACEYADKATLEAVSENLGLKPPIDDSFPFYMMVETSGSNGTHDEEKLNTFLEAAMTEKFVTDGTIATQPSHVKAIWSIRERFPEALLKDGHLTVYDFSLPLDHFDEMVEETRSFLGTACKRVAGFGHLGDCNLHLNVTMDNFNPNTLAKAEPFVYDYVAQRRGSISSEHGLGSIKRDYIYYSKSPQAVHYMRELKKLMDPKGILNPYKVIPNV